VAYYLETNVLVPIRSVAAKSNQPAAKCVRITLTPARPWTSPGRLSTTICIVPGAANHEE
jgi:hypothetical protein